MNENNKLKWKSGTLLAPVPAVMVSCGTMDEPNIITIAWTGIINSDPAKTYISVRPSRYSYDIIKKTRKFVINLTNEPLARATDFCGVRSGRDMNKFDKCGLTAAPALELEDTPVIAQSPICIECRVTDIIPLGTHDMFIADIVAVDVDPALVDEKGALHLERAKLIASSHGEYFALGKKVGDFGFSVRKKSTEKRRAAAKRGQVQKKRTAPKKKS